MPTPEEFSLPSPEALKALPEEERTRMIIYFTQRQMANILLGEKIEGYQDTIGDLRIKVINLANAVRLRRITQQSQESCYITYNSESNTMQVQGWTPYFQKGNGYAGYPYGDGADLVATIIPERITPFHATLIDKDLFPKNNGMLIVVEPRSQFVKKGKYLRIASVTLIRRPPGLSEEAHKRMGLVGIIPTLMGQVWELSEAGCNITRLQLTGAGNLISVGGSRR